MSQVKYHSFLSVRIVMDGGYLSVFWDDTDKHIYMKGSAEKVFDGTIELEE